MSEFMNVDGKTLRLQLLVTVSALALFAAFYGSNSAVASDEGTDQPTVWIELGGQLERDSRGADPFALPFVVAVAQAGMTSPAFVQRQAPYSNGAQAKITFEPENTNWIFSASVRYGRTQRSQHLHEEKTLPPELVPFGRKYTTRTPDPDVADTAARNRQAHTIADFQAGKDVGLGMFGHGSKSTISFGISMAQFTSSSEVNMYALPNSRLVPVPFPPFPLPLSLNFKDNYIANAEMQHSFHGIGPSVAWENLAPLLGDPRNGELALNWGANAAILFGRQKVSGRHHAIDYDRAYNNHGVVYTTPYDLTTQVSRAHSVTVPNVGGFAGVSYRLEDFKIALGYRADFFFGAVDGGVDTTHKVTPGFYGPFANISIGIGG